MWLKTTMQPPVAGMCSPPSQVRLVVASSAGFTTGTARLNAQPRGCCRSRTVTREGYSVGDSADRAGLEGSARCRDRARLVRRPAPVKPPGRGKTRLGDLPRDGSPRRSRGTPPSAASRRRPSREVLVVTDDAVVRLVHVELGCDGHPRRRLGRPQRQPVLAATEAARRWPDLVPVAICRRPARLTAADLETALVATAGPAAVRRRRVRRGDDALHRAARGVRTAVRVPLRGAAPGGRRLPDRRAIFLRLRLDVDDADDLAAAVRLGVGPHTQSVVAALPVGNT